MYSFPNVEPAHCSVSILTFASWPAYRFLRRQVRRSGILVSLRNFPQFDVIHTVKGFGLVNTEEIEVFFFFFFLEFSCFLYVPTDAGNWISCSSAFSQSTLNIWKFLVHVLLKPCWDNFKHFFGSMWNECNCLVLWTFFGIALLWGLERKVTFSSPVATAEFSKFTGIFSATL